MRRFGIALGAVLVVAGCASSGTSGGGAGQVTAQSFRSDRISIETRGTGPDLILIPGVTCHRDVWLPLAERLEGKHRLHLVQVNGFAGFVPGANADGPVSAPVAEEIARYIRETRLQRPTVIGHSMGGTIGLMLAARHPELVGRLMVIDMLPFLGVAFGPPGTTPESARPIADQIRAQMLALPPGAPTMMEQMIPTMTRVEAMRPMLLQGVRESHRPTVANAFHELIVTDLRPELSRITAPMSVLYVVPPNPPVPADQYEAGLRESYANAPKARLVKIEESLHFIQFDQPVRVAAELTALMKR
ncbi:MAG: alpha/beta fold hydrolase [Gemmatimonadales bacterium]